MTWIMHTEQHRVVVKVPYKRSLFPSVPHFKILSLYAPDRLSCWFPPSAH